jgi:DNA end-binding protein Ku
VRNRTLLSASLSTRSLRTPSNDAASKNSRSCHEYEYNREHVIALEPRDQGMIGYTLRYPYEVRDEKDYFDEIEDEKVPKDMLDLAVHIVETKKGKFEPEKFEDQYEDALKEIIRKKQKGEKIERPKEPARGKVVDLMDALRQNVEAGGQRKKAAAHYHRQPKKTSGSHSRHKKAS